MKIEFERETKDSILTLARIKDDFLEWDKHLRILKNTKEMFSSFRISISMGHSSMGRLHGLILTIFDLKAKCDFDEIISYLKKLGCVETEKPQDYPELSRHTVFLKFLNTPIKINAFFEGGSCTYEVVGKEEKPIYQLKCKEVN